MKQKLTFFTLFLLGSMYLAHGQNIQWASELEYEYNNYDFDLYSGKQALGKPDAKPEGNLSPNSFRLKSESGFGSIIVKFANPQKISQVLIVESNLPGNVVDVQLYDVDGKNFRVYKGHSHKLNVDGRVMVILLPETYYQVSKVEVNLNTIYNSGWSQIDAVGISNAPNIKLLEDELAMMVSYGVDQVMATTGDREKLGDMINTEYPEINPIITHDGKTLYFSRAAYPANIGGQGDEQDIYVTTLQGNEWGKAENIGAPLNNQRPNGVSSVSPDGNTLLLINDYEVDELGHSDLSISYRAKDGWSYPENVHVENLKNKSRYVDYYLGSSGKILLMAIEDKKSLGDQDLYVSFMGDDQKSWTAPLNLGETINTPMAEFSPFLASDNKTLYFASYGYEGFGESDIYFSRRLDDSWTNWSPPKNLGDAINTSGLDAYYSITADGHYAYFVSEDPFVPGSRDIYRIALSHEYQPEPVLFIVGKVFNRITGEPIGARIVFESLPDGQEEGVARSNPATGEYKIILPIGKLYGYRAEADGFLSVNENVNLNEAKEYTEVYKNLYLVPFGEDNSMIVNNIWFEQGQSDLLPTSLPEMARLTVAMYRNKDMKIRISSYSDDLGGDQANIQLTESRAQKLREFLISKGIDGNRIEAQGMGNGRPNPNSPELLNRIELTILGI